VLQEPGLYRRALFKIEGAGDDRPKKGKKCYIMERVLEKRIKNGQKRRPSGGLVAACVPAVLTCVSKSKARAGGGSGEAVKPKEREEKRVCA